MNKLIQADTADAENLMQIIEGKWHLFANIDRTFSIEKGVCQALMGQAGVDLMEEKIMQVLPSADVKASIDGCCNAMLALKEGPVYKFVGSEARETLTSTLEVLSDVRAGHCPKEKYMTSGPMVRVKARLPFLCQHTVHTKDKGKAVETLLTGSDAVAAKLKVIKDTLQTMCNF